jgi:hypothetical protein
VSIISSPQNKPASARPRIIAAAACKLQIAVDFSSPTQQLRLDLHLTMKPLLPIPEIKKRNKRRKTEKR